VYHFDCPQCGAPAPAPPVRLCPYCKYQYPVAAGTHAPDGFGLNWLLDRARAHLGAVPTVQIGRAITARSLDEARRSYARGALEDEPIVALHDPRGAYDGVGWAITQRRFCWSAVDGPRELEWRKLDPTGIVHIHPTLSVMGISIPAEDPDVARSLAALLRVLALTASAIPSAPTEAPKFDDPTLLARFRHMVPGAKDLYVAPDIPPNKEANARAVYGAEIRPAERVLALYDATWFGSGDEGWILTSRRVYATASWGPVWVNLDNIVNEGVSVLGDYVDIQMRVALTGPKNVLYQLAGFFRSLAKY
jgi:hypothetical protein